MKAMIITGAFIMLLFVVLGSIAQAHEHDGMAYDSWCCSGKDCAPAQVEFIGNSQIKATTKYGTATFDLKTLPKFRLKTSTDGQYHACIVKFSAEKGRCLYVPAGI